MPKIFGVVPSATIVTMWQVEPTAGRAVTRTLIPTNRHFVARLKKTPSQVDGSKRGKRGRWASFRSVYQRLRGCLCYHYSNILSSLHGWDKCTDFCFPRFMLDLRTSLRIIANAKLAERYQLCDLSGNPNFFVIVVWSQSHSLVVRSLLVHVPRFASHQVDSSWWPSVSESNAFDHWWFCSALV